VAAVPWASVESASAQLAAAYVAEQVDVERSLAAETLQCERRRSAQWQGRIPNS
jgi:hypothetical protein